MPSEMQVNEVVKAQIVGTSVPNYINDNYKKQSK